jgi:hypothetical protein
MPNRSGDPAVIDAGAARSVQEATDAISEQPCPKCGGAKILQHEEKPAAGFVWAATSFCSQCNSRWVDQFTAGPGWDTQPGPRDPRYAVTSQPSTLIAEKVFRTWLDGAVKRLRAPRSSDGPSHQQERARVALGALLELEKFAVARGQALPAELAELRPWLIEQFESAGGVVPPGVS